MSVDPVTLIARTLLYEGYLLYPYRPSAVKNRQRFNFGVLYPEDWCRPGSGDASSLTTEFPLRNGGDAHLDVEVRFLQMIARADGDRGGDVDDVARPSEVWHEAIERDVSAGRIAIAHLARDTSTSLSSDPSRRPSNGTADGAPETVRVPFDTGVIRGEIAIGAEHLRDGVFKVTVHVRNLTRLDADTEGAARDHALLRSLVSTHVVITATGGELISLLDPPADLHDVAASCRNVGVWPVLVGEPGSRDRMLASPIILYDYPHVAPESAGDLFDGTEVDEILALRILTLTDDEKQEARKADPRARQILDRTEAMPAEMWARLHGAVRGLRPFERNAR